jgi:hypothetical protein
LQAFWGKEEGSIFSGLVAIPVAAAKSFAKCRNGLSFTCINLARNAHRNLIYENLEKYTPVRQIFEPFDRLSGGVGQEEGDAAGGRPQGVLALDHPRQADV